MDGIEEDFSNQIHLSIEQKELVICSLKQRLKEREDVFSHFKESMEVESQYCMMLKEEVLKLYSDNKKLIDLNKESEVTNVDNLKENQKKIQTQLSELHGLKVLVKKLKKDKTVIEKKLNSKIQQLQEESKKIAILSSEVSHLYIFIEEEKEDNSNLRKNVKRNSNEKIKFLSAIESLQNNFSKFSESSTKYKTELTEQFDNLEHINKETERKLNIISIQTDEILKLKSNVVMVEKALTESEYNINNMFSLHKVEKAKLNVEKQNLSHRRNDDQTEDSKKNKLGIFGKFGHTFKGNSAEMKNWNHSYIVSFPIWEELIKKFCLVILNRILES